MDKKNTMLLTVIAVATLLVAVVGATFAFFSISTDGSSSTQATVNTAKVGSIVYANVDENKTLAIGVTAQDMAKQDADKMFYAMPKPETWGTEEGQSLIANTGTEDPLDVATVKLSGANEGDVYTCSATITVTLKGTMLEKDQDAARIKAGWLKLALTGDSDFIPQAASSKISEIDLSTLAATLESNVTATTEGVSETYDLTGFTMTADASGEATRTLKAVLSLENTSSPQNEIAGRSLEVTIALAPKAESQCKVTAASTD